MNIIAPDVRILSDVPRWGIVRTIRRQNVAEHSFHVAMIVRKLLDSSFLEDLNIPAAGRLCCLEYALDHDLDEAVSGDIPATFKRGLPRTGTSGGLAAKVVKLADCIEALCFLMEEQALGNFTARQVVNDLWCAVESAAHDLLPVESAGAIIGHLRREMDSIANEGHNYAAYIHNLRLDARR